MARHSLLFFRHVGIKKCSARLAFKHFEYTKCNQWGQNAKKNEIYTSLCKSGMGLIKGNHCSVWSDDQNTNTHTESVCVCAIVDDGEVVAVVDAAATDFVFVVNIRSVVIAMALLCVVFLARKIEWMECSSHLLLFVYALPILFSFSFLFIVFFLLKLLWFFFYRRVCSNNSLSFSLSMCVCVCVDRFFFSSRHRCVRFSNECSAFSNAWHSVYGYLCLSQTHSTRRGAPYVWSCFIHLFACCM